MPSNPRIRTRLRWFCLSLACSLFAVSSVYSWYPKTIPGRVLNFRYALIWELLRWNLWLPLAALILRIDAHRRAGPVRTPVWYASACLGFPLLHIALRLALYYPLSPVGLVIFLRKRSASLIPEMLTDVIITALILGWAHARGEESRASRLQVQLAQAQLEALKMQLHPHFLFNTLNAISALQLDDPPAAQKMLVRLSEFLRLTLENSGAQMVSVEREVEFLTRYLEIERSRFPQKLSVHISVDPEARSVLVPNLILQPLVENAIRHGIAAQVAPGRVEVHAARVNGSLSLRVFDSGPGIVGAVHRGRGLTITQSRLDRLYGSASRLSIENVAGGGLEVRLEIPVCAS